MPNEHQDAGEARTDPVPGAVAVRSAPEVVWTPTSGKGGITFATKANPKLIIHTTETQGLPSYPYPPHVTIDLDSPGRIWQHVTGDKGSYALKSADQSPNYECGAVYQVEHISYAKDTPAWTDLHYESLAREVAWFHRNKGVPLVFVPVWEDGSAYGDWSGRMSPGEFTEFSGVCGHQHVHSPNDHWDPGKLDVPRLRAAIDEILDTTPEEPGGEEMLITEGAGGNGVRSIQRALNKWSDLNDKGFNVAVDGTWEVNSKMTDHVKTFQKALNLTATGDVDGLTASFLVGRYDPPSGL